MTTISVRNELGFYTPISIACISAGIAVISSTMNQSLTSPNLYRAGIICGGVLCFAGAATMVRVVTKVSSCVLTKIGEFATSFTCRNDCIVGLQAATMGGIGCAVSLFHEQYPWAAGCFVAAAAASAYLVVNREYLYVAPVEDDTGPNLEPYHLDAPCVFGNRDHSFQMNSAGAVLEILKFEDDWRRQNYLNFVGVTASEIRELIKQNLKHVKQDYKTRSGELYKGSDRECSLLKTLLYLKHGLSNSGTTALTPSQLAQRQILRSKLEIKHPNIYDADGNIWIEGKTITFYLEQIRKELQTFEEVQRDAPYIVYKDMI